MAILVRAEGTLRLAAQERSAPEGAPPRRPLMPPLQSAAWELHSQRRCRKPAKLAPAEERANAILQADLQDYRENLDSSPFTVQHKGWQFQKGWAERNVARRPDHDFNSPRFRLFSHAVRDDSSQNARRPKPGQPSPIRRPARRSSQCESAIRDKRQCSRPGSSRFPETDSSHSLAVAQWIILVPSSDGLTQGGILPIVDRVDCSPRKEYSWHPPQHRLLPH